MSTLAVSPVTEMSRSDFQPANSAVLEPLRRRATVLLWWAVLFVTLLVQVPGMGNVDSARRLQVTRSWWTDEPPVVVDARDPARDPFGIPGLNGVVHAWYGAGQSALLLPADLVAGLIDRNISDIKQRRSIRSGIVATLTFPPLVATTIVLVFLWLGQLGFSPVERWFGAIGMLLGSSYLYYTQSHMENSLQVFLLVVDAFCVWQWIADGRRLWLILAGLSIGAALTIRLPALGEHCGVWLAALMVCVHRAHDQSRAAGRWLAWADLSVSCRPLQILSWVSPGVILGFAADRYYHWVRFGQWSGTYVSLMGRQILGRNKTMNPKFPFDGDFWDGFWGPLIGPSRGVFLFDPLALVLVVLAVWHWRKITGSVRASLIGLIVAFFILVCFYAPVSFWSGGAGWGNRYTLTPLHLALALALPLWLRHLGRDTAITMNLLPTTVIVAFTVQLLSILLPAQVESGQMDDLASSMPVPVQRAINVVAVLRGEPAPAGLSAAEWRINLAPVTLSGGSAGLAAAMWVVWGFGALATGLLLVRCWRAVRAWDEAEEDGLADSEMSVP